MRIAIVDHSFHRKTGSSAFFRRILEGLGTVTVFWDDSWRTGRVDTSLVRGLLDGEFDRIVFYQVFWPTELVLQLGITEAVFVPMYDDIRRKNSEWWKGYRGCRFINFSRALDDQLEQHAGECLSVQYFPEPVESNRTSDGGLVGFFWQRNRSLQWKTIWNVASGIEWKQFNLHWVPDPGQRTAARPSKDFCSQYSICFSEWFDDPSEFAKLMSSADVYFAPRLYEGIGMGFLEAMARGQCVVAPDSATHNEYITSGVNGILYDPEVPGPVALADARVLGAAARNSCREGYVHWKAQENQIRNFVNASPCVIDCDRARRTLSDASPSSRLWRTRGSIFERVGRKLMRVFSSSK